LFIAIVREISPNIGKCELTHFEREPIDFGRASAQHGEYRNCLERLGCTVISLPAEPDLPDSVFVEDAALVLDELAVILRPGAPSRRSETLSIAMALEPYRQLARLESPATMDGGDVLKIGKRIFVGLTTRSNAAGIEQLRAILKPLGYEVEGLPVRGCLHLKSAVTQVAADALLVNRSYLDADALPAMRRIEVDPTEPHAANGLWLDRSVIFPTAYPNTRRRLEQQGIEVHPVDISELSKAEAAVTCCSLLIRQ
jgi:dimethylargininase